MEGKPLNRSQWRRLLRKRRRGRGKRRTETATSLHGFTSYKQQATGCLCADTKRSEKR
jgi:hypothetical protein